MVDRVLMWAAANAELQRQVLENPIAREAAHRFVAGERLQEALDAAAEPNARGIGGILDLVGDGVEDPSGARQAVAGYEAATQAIGARGADSTISVEPRPRVRSVRGAYAQPVEQAQRSTSGIRAQSEFLTDRLFRHGSDPAFGTHDDELIAQVRQAADEAGEKPEEIEFHFLYGIRRNLRRSSWTAVTASACTSPSVRPGTSCHRLPLPVHGGLMFLAPGSGVAAWEGGHAPAVRRARHTGTELRTPGRTAPAAPSVALRTPRTVLRRR